MKQNIQKLALQLYKHNSVNHFNILTGNIAFIKSLNCVSISEISFYPQISNQPVGYVADIITRILTRQELTHWWAALIYYV